MHVCAEFIQDTVPILILDTIEANKTNFDRPLYYINIILLKAIRLNTDAQMKVG